MPRRKLKFAQGAYYHIYNRGAARASIFHEAADYAAMLWTLKHYLPRLQLTLIAYCLMPNHYHWLVRQDGTFNAGLLPTRVCKSYANRFNHKYQRSGTLFESRFKAIPIDNDAYLRHLCRYIHANPVKDAIATAPELWPYSNYCDWIGHRAGTLVDHAFVATHFPNRHTCRRFVLDYLTGRDAMPQTLADYLAAL